ncbi:uncharacterized protein [Dendropsophus ebraccatus]|uniref:uncharacterized protein isoform X2 n=1 Tax=Dendropsophus ebraccatus TaxID=150705 RepID=UPI003831567A
MLKNSKSWDSLTNILAHDDQSQKDSSSLGQHSIKMALQQMPETMDIIAMNKGEDTNYDNGMTNSGNYDDRTSETVSLLTLNEDEDDDGPSTGVKWPPLKEHKKVILYPWTGLSRRPSFFKKMTKASKEERKPLITNAKKAESYEDKTEDACPRVNHDKMSKLNHKMENFMRRSKCAVKEVVLCPVVGDLVENKNGPEWAEEVDVQPYFMQTMVELSEQLQMEEKSQLKNDTRYLDVWPIAEQNQAAQVLLGLENRRCPIAAEIAQLQLQIKLLEPEQGHMRNQPYLAHEEEESVGPQAVDHLENPSTYLPLSQESTSYACPVQDIPPYSYKRAPSLTLIPSSSQAGGITGTLGSKCSSTDPFTTEITAVKNRQDLLEKQFLHLSSGYYSDYNNIMEFLRAQHLRKSWFYFTVAFPTLRLNRKTIRHR